MRQKREALQVLYMCMISFENRQETPQVAYEGDSVKTLIRETSSKPRLEENSNR